MPDHNMLDMDSADVEQQNFTFQEIQHMRQRMTILEEHVGIFTLWIVISDAIVLQLSGTLVCFQMLNAKIML